MTTENIHTIVNLTNKRAQPIEWVCSKARITMTQLHSAVQEAGRRGFQISLKDGFIFSQVAVRAEKKLVLGSTKPDRKAVALWTDTHFGCRHTAEDDAAEFLTRAWKEGARVCAHTGDLLDGNRPVLLGDQNWVGFDSQLARLRRVLRKAPPFEYVSIDGNHDGYYSSAIGTPSGRLVEARLKEAGIKWHFAGVCEGRAQIDGADWFFWHPHGGSQSRHGVRKVLAEKAGSLQEHIDILAMGHLHKFVSFTQYPENVHCVCAGTYQRMRSEFANRMSDPWDIGATLVSWDWDGKRVSAVAADFRPARA